MPPVVPSPPDQMMISFMTIRKWIGLLGILLVPVLIVGSLMLDKPPEIQISASAYYHTSMRNALVGIICAISLYLLSYHGYNRQDSILSKLAGVFALGIAFFPTSETNDKTDILSTLHYIISALFLVAISYMSIFLFTKSAGNKTERKIKRNRIYRTCGIVMLICIAGIPLARVAFFEYSIAWKTTLIFEWLALTAFGFSWLTKGEFILKDKTKPEPQKESLKSVQHAIYPVFISKDEPAPKEKVSDLNKQQ